MIDMNKVKETGNTFKINIGGENQSKKVYKIPLDLLYYNDKNDRIATFMSQYIDEGNSLDLNDKEHYNNIMHEFIKKSNSKALERTKINIKNFQQQRPGVVLADGRIIDGNRRFTCLRELRKEGDTRDYEAIIITQEENFTDQDIKRLELRLQHGEEKPVDYNPIDELVGVYNTIEKQKLLTIEEYAYEVNVKENTVQKSLEIARLMNDFLEFINQPEKFHIARDLQIDGPLREMPGIINKVPQNQQSEVKMVLFSALVSTNEKDKTRFIRDVGRYILKTPSNRNKFIKEYEPVIKHTYETAKNNSKDITDASELMLKIKEDKNIIKKGDDIVNETILSEKINNERQRPIEILDDINNRISKINLDIVLKMAPNESTEFKSALDDLNDKIGTLEEAIENA